MAKNNQGTTSGKSPQRTEPLKVFRVDDVSSSIFARNQVVNGEQVTFYSVSFSRSYRDSSGKREYVKYFNLEDLAKVIAVAQQADEYIRDLVKD